MDELGETYSYVWLLMAIVSSVLAVALAGTVKDLVGKRWLVASTVIVLFTKPLFQIVSLIARQAEDPRQVFAWHDVLNLFALFATACFGLFVFLNWAHSRMKLDSTNLLFSFTGRVSRSAFWISLCILCPLFTLVGFAPSMTRGEGLPLVIIWIVYVGSMILSVWISLAVYAKRWHDCGKSGWMSLVLLIPIVGVFWFLGYLGFVKGTPGSNKYGADSLEVQAT
jgi:uncharacterized membrane protein YhaH (DUF805 family)